MEIVKLATLEALRDLMQEDVADRGLARDPRDNLIAANPADFAFACQSLADADDLSVAIVTGFPIPPSFAGETDGPIGAVYLARVLHRLGARVAIHAEPFAGDAMVAAIAHLGLGTEIAVLPPPARLRPEWTHLIAIERVGPSHTRASLVAQPRRGPAPETAFLTQVPPEHWDQCHTMRGTIITDQLLPAHRLFEQANMHKGLTTIGVGDGGNEIGMGRLRWETIARNIPNGAITACRIATDFNLVSGISNWGAYALALGTAYCRGCHLAFDEFSAETETAVWRHAQNRAPLVDGVTGQATLSVDGMDWARHVRRLDEMLMLIDATSKPGTRHG
jgi:hypothetical protein